MQNQEKEELNIIKSPGELHLFPDRGPNSTTDHQILTAPSAWTEKTAKPSALPPCSGSHPETPRLSHSISHWAMKSF